MLIALMTALLASSPDGGAALRDASLTVDAGPEDLTVSVENQELRFWRGMKREQTLQTTEGTHFVTVSGRGITWRGWVELKPGDNALPLWKPLEVTGVVLAADGSRATHARVEIESEQLSWNGHGISAPRYQRFSREAALDGGSFSVMVAEPGAYRLHAYDPEVGFVQTDLQVPGKPAQLRLEPGATLEVHWGQPYGVALYTPGPHWDHAEPIAVARPDAGVATFPNLRGQFEVAEAWMPLAFGVATLDGGAWTLGPPDTQRIIGHLRGFTRHAVPKSQMVCARTGRGGQCGEIDADGGFSIAVVPEITYELELSVRDQWLAERVHAKGGDQLELEATPFRPVTIPVTDETGKPLERFKSGGKTLSKSIKVTQTGYLSVQAPQFISRTLEIKPGALPKEIRLARLPLTGTVRDEQGAPVAGAAVVLRCADEPDQPVRLRRHDPDMGLPWWSYWPDGLECIVAQTQTGTDGRFSFARVSEYPGTVTTIEARQGHRSVAQAFEPHGPIELVLH